MCAQAPKHIGVERMVMTKRLVRIAHEHVHNDLGFDIQWLYSPNSFSRSQENDGTVPIAYQAADSRLKAPP